MKQISDKSLVTLLIIILAVSVIGTALNLGMIKTQQALPEITGKAAQGTVQLTIISLINIHIPSSEINFGSGAINQTIGLSTEQVNPGTFNSCIEQNGTYNHPFECRGIQIENIGSVNVNLTMSSNKDGDSLLLGDNATDEFMFAIAEGNLSGNYSDSCKVNSHDNQSLFPEGTSYLTRFMNWTPINKSFIYTICHNFSFKFNEGSLVLEVNLTIPADEGGYSPGQERTAALSFAAESVD